MDQTLLWIGVLFVSKIATGIALWRLGRPVHTAMLTVHKLIALGLLALLFIYFRPLLGTAGGEGWAAIITGGLFYLVAIVTGGLASLAKPAGRLVVAGHRVAPVLVIIALLFVLYRG